MMDKQAQWDIETLQKTIDVIPYEEIERDALERAIEALEKQVPKKVIEAGKYGIEKSCPNCKSEVKGMYFYCTVCGQRLRWESENEEVECI